MVEIVKEMIGINDSDLVVKFFRERFNFIESFFNDVLILVNELNKEVYKRCSNFIGVEKYCFKWWVVM